MAGFSGNILSRFYDAFECYLIKDYTSILEIIQNTLSCNGQETLVDVGGGTGYILKQIYQSVHTSINIDLSYQMLLQQKNMDIARIQANGIHLPLQQNSVDIIFLFNTLHHIDKKHHKTIIKEIFRVLKHHGIFLLIDLYYPMTFLNTLFTMIEEFCVGKTYHQSSKTLSTLLSEVGFTQISFQYLDKNNWNFGIHAKKETA